METLIIRSILIIELIFCINMLVWIDIINIFSITLLIGIIFYIIINIDKSIKIIKEY
jgi:hypothetical protein